MKPLDWTTALLVVDMQKGFEDPAWGRRNNRDAEQRVASLIQHWRAAHAPVVHVHHCSSTPAGRFRPGTRGHEPMDAAIPQAGEAVYRKWVNSAFIGTTLEIDLRQQGVENLVVVGLTTNHCISTTVRMAGNLGFRTFVVADATATFGRAGADGRARLAEEVHNAALGDLHMEFAEVIDSDALMSARPIGSMVQSL
jgi:nicotinamidase-related amidase